MNTAKAPPAAAAHLCLILRLIREAVPVTVESATVRRRNGRAVTSKSANIATAAAVAAAGALLWSAAATWLDFGQRVADLGRGWGHIGYAVGIVAASLLPIADVSLGVSWIYGDKAQRSRVASVALTYMLVCIGSLFWRMEQIGPKPACDCFAIVAAWHRSASEAWHSLRLDCIIAAAALLGIAAGWADRIRQSPVGGASAAPAPVSLAPCRQGATLLEVISVIAIISLVIIGGIPSLQIARSRGDQIGSLSNLRQHTQVLSAYTIDYAEMYPFFTDPHAHYSVVRNGSAWARVKFFDASVCWNIALAPGYYEGVHRSPMFTTPEGNRRGSGLGPNFAEYAYSSNFITDFRYWEPESRMSDRSQWRPVKAPEVAFVSRKGILFSRPAWFRPAFYPPQYEIGFVDGSSRIIPSAEVTPPYRGGDGAGDASSSGIAMPIVHTPRGYRGFDVR